MRLALSICLWLCLQSAAAQPLSPKMVPVGEFSLPQEPLLPAISPQWQLLAASSSGKILSFDTLGKLQQSSSQPRWIAPSYLHSQSSLRTLLFSAEAQRAFWIDRLLGNDQEVSLPFDAFLTAIAPSTDNQLWGFDQNELRLIKIGNSGDILQEIPMLGSPLVQASQTLDCKQLLIAHGSLFALFEGLGVHRWSLTGSYLGKMGESSSRHLSLSGQFIFLWQSGQLIAYKADNLTAPAHRILLPHAKARWEIALPYAISVQEGKGTIFKLTSFE